MSLIGILQVLLPVYLYMHCFILFGVHIVVLMLLRITIDHPYY